jgi:hypothetical protein
VDLISTNKTKGKQTNKLPSFIEDNALGFVTASLAGFTGLIVS